ncbi:MAG: hypothetical protein NTZ20_04825 [Candidatus Levybacteria bacterium]|nr:hypothetical protein [Candidatus Levybacteria bacterium]
MSVIGADGIERVTYLSRFNIMDTEEKFIRTINRVHLMNIIHYKTHQDDVDKVFVLYFIVWGKTLLHYGVPIDILRGLRVALQINPHKSTLDVVNRLLSV